MNNFLLDAAVTIEALLFDAGIGALMQLIAGDAGGQGQTEGVLQAGNDIGQPRGDGVKGGDEEPLMGEQWEQEFVKGDVAVETVLDRVAIVDGPRDDGVSWCANRETDGFTGIDREIDGRGAMEMRLDAELARGEFVENHFQVGIGAAGKSFQTEVVVGIFYRAMISQQATVGVETGARPEDAASCVICGGMAAENLGEHRTKGRADGQWR